MTDQSSACRRHRLLFVPLRTKMARNAWPRLPFMTGSLGYSPMRDKKAGADTNHFKMKPKPGAPPGLETDGEGHVIPFAQRTEDDQAKARAAAGGRGKEDSR